MGQVMELFSREQGRPMEPKEENSKARFDPGWMNICRNILSSFTGSDHYDFIIGNAPYLANGCFNLRDLYRGNEMDLQRLF